MASQSEVHLGISRLHHPVTTLGPGRRAGIWVQGCSIGCRGCVSKDTWDPADADDKVPLTDVTDWLDRVSREGVDGVTISGGEPFDQALELKELALLLRDRIGPHRDMLVFSGYTQAKLRKRYEDVLELFDAAVLGPYMDSKPTNLPLRGSSNQELVLISSLGRRLYSDLPNDEAPRMQLSIDGQSVRMIGIPRQGNMEELRQALLSRGVDLGHCSWLS